MPMYTTQQTDTPITSDQDNVVFSNCPNSLKRALSPMWQMCSVCPGQVFAHFTGIGMQAGILNLCGRVKAFPRHHTPTKHNESRLKSWKLLPGTKAQNPNPDLPHNTPRKATGPGKFMASLPRGASRQLIVYIATTLRGPVWVPLSTHSTSSYGRPLDQHLLHWGQEDTQQTPRKGWKASWMALSVPPHTGEILDNECKSTLMRLHVRRHV